MTYITNVVRPGAVKIKEGPGHGQGTIATEVVVANRAYAVLEGSQVGIKGDDVILGDSQGGIEGNNVGLGDVQVVADGSDVGSVYELRVRGVIYRRDLTKRGKGDKAKSRDKKVFKRHQSLLLF